MIDGALASLDMKVLIRHFGNYRQFVIPNYVHIVGGHCFSRCNALEKVIFAPNSRVHSIRQDAFSRLQLREIVIPKSVVVIEESGFCECSLLEHIVFESKSVLCEIRESAFSGTKLNRIRFPQSLEFLGAQCFYRTPLRKLSFEPPSRLQAIGSNAFRETQITKVLIPKLVETIPDSCFSGCTGLTQLLFEGRSTLMSIGMKAFLKTAIKTVSLPRSLQELGVCCFASTLLSKVEIGVNSCLRTIGDGAFRKSCINVLAIALDDPTQLSFSDPGCEVRIIKADAPAAEAGLVPQVLPVRKSIFEPKAPASARNGRHREKPKGVQLPPLRYPHQPLPVFV
jgi:hypothetical protein